MFLHLLRTSEFGDLAKLCSPSLFSVLSASAVARSVKTLMASRSADIHAAICARQGVLHARDRVRIVSALPQSSAAPSEARAREDAGSSLLLVSDDALLDMRKNAFAFSDGATTWAPKPLSVTWQPAFIGGLRDTYRGFYGGDDARFRAGLAALDLASAESLFREHFGADPGAVHFSTKDFTHTFSLVFEACARAQAKLSADFLPFGFLLGALYQSLETLDVTLDVRAAFEAVVAEAS